MAIHRRKHAFLLSSAALTLLMAAPTLAQDTTQEPIVLETVVLTAEEQIKQALGVSNISAEDLEKQPVTNDVSEIIRKMPGVNMTGTTASGQRGNQRQIDIRGMGPENTLILIDGRPVLSRNSVRMGRTGERDTRGDSNWVPAEMIERIEVLRGPAAARYGSGAAGGVVNIVTKRPEAFSGQVATHLTFPDDSREGGNRRANFLIGGPLGESLTFRLSGNYNKTDADDPDLNESASTDAEIENIYAGREGVENKDIGALLGWQINDAHAVDFEFDFSRQGNIFAGDTQNGSTNDFVEALAGEGAETNRMYRRALSVTHRGEYDFGESFSYLQWENTRNTRLCEGTAGRTEGAIGACVDTDGDEINDAFEYRTITLDNVTAKTEWNLPMDLGGKPQVVTLGAEYRGEFMKDPVSNRQDLTDIVIPGIDPEGDNRDSKTDQYTIGLYVENNILWNDRLTLTPGLRFDHNSNFGSNWSPSLNATYDFNEEWSMKVGVARAFKVPNLYQLNPNYVYVTNGNGCPFPYYQNGPCYVIGNADLEAETSINKEIGFAYNGLNGVSGSLTYFHNDYKNRIASGMVQLNGESTPRLYRWENTDKAVISGLEGSFATPLGERFALGVNATYMIKSEDKTNGQPLSLIPKYTLNASLDWLATDRMTVTLSATHYGKIEAAEVNSTTGYDYEDLDSRPEYTLVNLGTVYDVTDTVRLSAGITNLFDKQLFRTNEGANTFNEPGRAYYLSLRKSF